MSLHISWRHSNSQILDRFCSLHRHRKVDEVFESVIIEAVSYTPMLKARGKDSGQELVMTLQDPNCHSLMTAHMQCHQ
jgi:hypothetical protein